MMKKQMIDLLERKNIYWEEAEVLGTNYFNIYFGKKLMVEIDLLDGSVQFMENITISRELMIIINNLANLK